MSASRSLVLSLALTVTAFSGVRADALNKDGFTWRAYRVGQGEISARSLAESDLFVSGALSGDFSQASDNTLRTFAPRLTLTIPRAYTPPTPTPSAPPTLAPVTTPTPTPTLPVTTAPVATFEPVAAPVNTSINTMPTATWTPTPTVPTTSTASGAVDAYINFGSGPYPYQQTLTVGASQPWYTSPVVERIFGGVPNSDQQAAFTNSVLQRVEQTYRQSGVPLVATTDPNTPAAHTLSVVSGTSYGPNPDAVGISVMGQSGFSFIDKFGSAGTVDELEWAVARNVAHELMHTFGVDHHDTTGHYLDSAVTNWSSLVDPSTTFGPEAVKELLSKDFRAVSSPYAPLGAQTLHAHVLGQPCPICAKAAAMMIQPMIQPLPVPEPSTWILWTTVLVGAAGFLRRRGRAQAA